MSITFRLFSVSMVAPVFALAFMGIARSGMYIIVAPIAYPLIVICTILLAFPLHVITSRFSLGPYSQLPLVVLVSSIFGFLVYLLFFPQAGFMPHLVTDYVGLGVAAGFSAWLVYNYGPIKLRDNAA